jgi:leucyl aminopeptidase
MEVRTAEFVADAGADLIAFATDTVSPTPDELGEALEAHGFEQEAGKATLVQFEGKLWAVAGLGRADEIDADAFRTAAGAVARVTEHVGGSLGWMLDPNISEVPVREQARAVLDGLILGGYSPGRWKGSQDRQEFDSLVLIGGGEEEQAEAERALVVARWTNRARDLSNSPPNELTPERLAEAAQRVAEESGGRVTVEASGPETLEELGMGSFGAVAQGSHNPARLIVLRYEPESAPEDVVLGLVGKAVTFDTGGISIKPALYMEDMKGDMSGGATVIAGIGAIAELGLPLRVVSVVGATENMVGGGSYRPGDIVTTRIGKTIEIVNTDAEGRLVLADVLPYAVELGATHLVDFATLTGAMEKALGDLYAGVFGNDQEWRDRVAEAGNRSGDLAWPLPIHRRFRRYTDSAFADLKNSSVRGQAIPAYAASFLQEFVGTTPWAHVDMAGPAYLRWPRPDYLHQIGGTGYGVRLIAELARSLA